MAAVEQGSMAQTAEHLGTLQPVVSKAIAELEATLGQKLLERGARGVTPTIYGHAFTGAARRSSTTGAPA